MFDCSSVGPKALVKKVGKRTFFILFVYVFGEAWGVDGGWTPLPTRTQQYCDPASLVSFFYLLLQLHLVLTWVVGYVLIPKFDS